MLWREGDEELTHGCGGSEATLKFTQHAHMDVGRTTMRVAEEEKVVSKRHISLLVAAEELFCWWWLFYTRCCEGSDGENEHPCFRCALEGGGWG